MTDHLLVARQRVVVVNATPGLYARPLDGEANTVESERGHEVDHSLVVAPQSLRVTRSFVATESDRRREARGGLVGPVKAALDGVPLQGRENARSLRHRVSFARRASNNSTSVSNGAPRGRLKESHG